MLRSLLATGTFTLSALLAFTVSSNAQDVLSIGSDLTYPPYNYVTDTGESAGFDTELMQAISAELGRDLQIKDVRFGDLIPAVNNDAFDVIASTLYIKPERAELVDYIPYMKTGVSIAVSKTSGHTFTTPAALCGYRVASIKGAAWITELNKLAETSCQNNPIQVIEYDTSPAASDAVIAGDADAQLEDSAALKIASIVRGGALKITSTENLYPVVVGLGVKKGNAALKATIETALEALKANGSYASLLKKYNLSTPTAEDFTKALGQ